MQATTLGKIPHAGDAGRGAAGVVEWMLALSDRLRRVRVACGDWSRVCTPSVTHCHGLTGVVLDPPYGEGSLDYAKASGISRAIVLGSPGVSQDELILMDLASSIEERVPIERFCTQVERGERRWPT